MLILHFATPEIAAGADGSKTERKQKSQAIRAQQRAETKKRLRMEQKERQLKAKKQVKIGDPFDDFNQMLHLGEHCSLTERRADDATRDPPPAATRSTVRQGA